MGEWHSVLDIVNLYDKQNNECLGGKSKTFQVAPIGAAWGSTVFRGCFSYHPPALLRAPRRSVARCFCDVAVRKTAWRLHGLMLFPSSGAGFWRGRGASSPRDSFHLPH